MENHPDELSYWTSKLAINSAERTINAHWQHTDNDMDSVENGGIETGAPSVSHSFPPLCHKSVAFMKTPVTGYKIVAPFCMSLL